MRVPGWLGPSSRAAEGFSTVTELADEIVRRTDLSFRQAHHVVGLTTLEAVKAGKTADQITSAMLDVAAREVVGRPLGLDEQVVKKALDPLENVRIRSVIGGPAPDEVRRMIEGRHAVLTQDWDRLGQRRALLTRAAEGLRAAVAAIMSS